jgi:hypothetical protein
MYQKYTVKIPDLQTGITRKTIKGTTYVYYTYGRTYISEKKYSQGKDTSIGKVDPGDDTMMYPNANFIRFFFRILFLKRLSRQREADVSGSEHLLLSVRSCRNTNLIRQSTH